MPHETLTPPAPSAMTARAVLHCERDGRGHRLTRLRSEGPLVLRPTNVAGFEPWTRGDPTAARVSLSAGAAGPLGGDRLSLEVRVGPGATLVLGEISATLALPGTSGHESEMRFDVSVEEGGTLVWLPQPVIAARGCRHRQRIRVRLAPSARFHVREELIVGRHGERPGSIAQRLRVERGGTALFDQDLRLGAGHPGWDSPAVAHGAKAVGTLLVVDPGSGIGRGRCDVIDEETVSVGIHDDAVQASAVAADSLTLARALDTALERIGAPWGA